ncbi:MAG: hypothetical protein IJY34_02820, partial [Clostridia bacterium]|nr:hypothetical protein [Clostridia bacterium]
MSTQTPETFETFATEEAQALAMPEFEALPDAPQVEETKKPKKKNRWFCRILAFLLAVAPILIYFLIPIKHLHQEGDPAYYVFENVKFFEHMFNMIKDGWGTNKDFFGVLPMHLSNSTMNLALTTIMYLIPVSLVVCAIFGLIALCSKKAAPYCLRFITGTGFVMTMLYATVMVLIAAWYDPAHHDVSVRWQDGLDFVLLGVAGVSFLIYVIASFVKAGKWALVDLILFLLTAVFVCAVTYGLISNPDLTRDFLTGGAEGNAIYSTITFILIGADVFFLICALIGISAKKLYGIDLVRAIFMTLVGGFLVVLCFLKGEEFQPLMLPSIVAAGSAFVMLIIEAITIGVRNAKKKKAAKAAKEAEAAEVASEFEALEEAPEAEAITFGEVSAEEAVAEESAEAVTAEEAVPFDPFLEGLSKEERKQFGELTLSLQKIEGMPRFEAGGDNKVFFRRIFVNLGSVRGLIPDELMEKIYQFT